MPNRGDCLSLLGLARDLGTFYTISEPLIYYDDNLDSLEIDFTNHSVKLPQYFFFNYRN